MSIKNKILIVFSVTVITLVSFVIFLTKKAPILSPKIFGVTFSAFYAEKFGLNWKETYTAILDELDASYIRIPVYWDEVEPQENAYDFSKVDWQLQEAERRGAHILFVIGKKLPRWPECHIPSWAKNISREDQGREIFNYLKITVERYRSSSALDAWQIENEPFFPFGECPSISKKVVDREIALVKSLDSRPVVITDSGELSFWFDAAGRADIFGSTLYRNVWNKFLGNITYPFPPQFYRLKRAITELAVGKKPMIIIELQAEPWIEKQTYETVVERQYTSMNPEKFRAVISYASQSGFDTFYLWGVEWWYWLKEKQDKPEMWDIARDTIRDANIGIYANDTNNKL